jgi:hypothetical protein
MEAKPNPIEKADSQEKPKEKLSFGKKFMNFLMYGGFIVVLILAVVIVILVEKFLKG